ncbi:MAG: hypothetical protein RL173_830 [Fibrobacterota bacterium]|jgi:hypothetical protein
MDGSSGPPSVIRSLWLVLFVAAFRAAFAVSGADSFHRLAGFAKLDSGDCAGAVAELLAARAQGDTSNSVMLGLSRALECDNRLVDALSATFADNKTDTTGRIDLLLFRAQLLRKVGLADEAEKVEREIGFGMVGNPAELDSLERLVADSEWDHLFGLSGTVQWTYDGLSFVAADSFPTYANMPRYQGWDQAMTPNVSISTPKEGSRDGDSLLFHGSQFVVQTQPTFQLFWKNLYASASIPFQTVLDKALSDWLAAELKASLQLGGSIKTTWGTYGFVFGASRSATWYPSVEAQLHNSLVGGVDYRLPIRFADFAQSNSVNLSSDEEYGFLSCLGSHQVSLTKQAGGFGSFVASGGYSWELYPAGEESYFVAGAPSKTIDVRGAAPGMLNDSEAIQFLASDGRVLTGLKRLQALTGAANGQAVSSSSGFDYPLSAKADRGKWNGTVSWSRRFGRGQILSASVDLARTEWASGQIGAFVPIDSVYASLLDTNKTISEIWFYRDVPTGQVYLVRDAVNGSIIGPYSYRRRRVDWTTTVQAGLTWPVGSHLKFTAQWARAVNESSLERISEIPTSYTRNVWTVSGVVTW